MGVEVKVCPRASMMRSGSLSGLDRALAACDGTLERGPAPLSLVAPRKQNRRDCEETEESRRISCQDLSRISIL